MLATVVNHGIDFDTVSELLHRNTPVAEYAVLSAVAVDRGAPYARQYLCGQAWFEFGASQIENIRRKAGAPRGRRLTISPERLHQAVYRRLAHPVPLGQLGYRYAVGFPQYPNHPLINILCSDRDFTRRPCVSRDLRCVAKT